MWLYDRYNTVTTNWYHTPGAFSENWHEPASAWENGFASAGFTEGPIGYHITGPHVVGGPGIQVWQAYGFAVRWITNNWNPYPPPDKRLYIIQTNALNTPQHSRGTLLQRNILGTETQFPQDGRHSDGFWYVRVGRAGTIIAPF